MAIVFVQSTGKIQKTATTVSPESFAFGSSATAGNTGIATFSYFQSSLAYITAVTIGGTAASLESRSVDGSGGTVDIWRAQNMTGGTTAIEVTSSTLAHYYSGSVEEWSGLDNVAADIVATAATGTSTAPSATYGTLAQADELVYILYGDQAGATLTTITPPTNYTELWEELNGVTNQAGSAAYRIVSSTTGASPAFTLNASITWRAILVTFKAAAGGGGGGGTKNFLTLGVG